MVPRGYVMLLSNHSHENHVLRPFIFYLAVIMTNTLNPDTFIVLTVDIYGLGDWLIGSNYLIYALHFFGN